MYFNLNFIISINHNLLGVLPVDSFSTFNSGYDNFIPFRDIGQ